MIRHFENNSIAEDLRVPPEVHEEDHLFLFLQNHPAIGPKAQEEYFKSARESADRIAAVIRRNLQPHGLAKLDTEAFTLLDFASGFGMVNRHFRNVLPGAQVDACDIHPEAIEFHRRYLGLDCCLSSDNPADLNISDHYDVVLALSFF